LRFGRLSSKMRPPGRARHRSGGRMQPEKQTSSKGLTIGLALLFGVAGASMTSDLENFWLGALLGALLAQVLHLRGRVNSLHEQLQSLRMIVEFPEPKKRPPPSQATAETTASPEPKPEVAPTAAPSPAVAAAQAPAEQVTSAVPPNVAQPTP